LKKNHIFAKKLLQEKLIFFSSKLVHTSLQLLGISFDEKHIWFGVWHPINDYNQ